MKRITLVLLALLLSFLFASCDVAPYEAPPLYLTSLIRDGEPCDREGRTATLYFPKEGEIVLTIDGTKRTGTYEKDPQKKHEDKAYGYYRFTLRDGTPGTFKIARFMFDGVYFECDLTVGETTYHFTDNENYKPDATAS